MQAIRRQPQRALDGAPVHYQRHRPEQTTGRVQAGDAIRLEAGPRELNLRELFLARARP